MSKWAEQWDSPLRWSVKSQRSQSLYVVDLATWECQCTYSRVNKHSLLHAEGMSRLNPQCQCFHKRTALNAFYEQYVKEQLTHTPVLCHFLKQELASGRQALTLAFVDHLNEQESAHKHEQEEENTITHPAIARKPEADYESETESEYW